VHEFEQRVRMIGVESFDGRADEQDTVPSLVQQAGVHDLVVLGQTDRSSPSATLDVAVPEQVLMHGGTATLVMPTTGRFERIGQNVVIAWNATRESARAVHDAMPILRRARVVHLVCLERESDLRHISRLQINDARDWLVRHGVELHVHQEPVRGDVGEALLSRADDLGADLVVMGGYGHSRMAEFLLGGVTRRLLAQMTTPVLLSH
jgi:nucleotide-binding universal stress UspA family protein